MPNGQTLTVDPSELDRGPGVLTVDPSELDENQQRKRLAPPAPVPAPKPQPRLQGLAGPATGLSAQPKETLVQGLESASPYWSLWAKFPTLRQRTEDVLREGIPTLSTRTVENPQFGEEQLLTPEAALRPLEQRRHPILTGVGQFAGGLTSPENVALIAGTGGLGGLPGAAGKIVPRLVSAGFSAQMLRSAWQQSPALAKAIETGDYPEAERLATVMGLTMATAGLAGGHALGGGPAVAAKPELAEAAPAPEPEAPTKLATEPAPGSLTAVREAEARMRARPEPTTRPVTVSPEEVQPAPAAPTRTDLERAGRMRPAGERATPAVVASPEEVAPVQAEAARPAAEAEIDRLVQVGRERMQAASQTARGLRPAEVDWLTDAELQRLHELQMALVPARQSERAGAGARVAEKRAARAAAAAQPEALERAEATGYQRQRAQSYINLVRNPLKRGYAQDYLRARLEGGAEPDRGPLSSMAAQTVRSNIEERLGAMKPTAPAEKFSPDVLQEAKEELTAAHELWSSLPPPGRFEAVAGEPFTVEEKGAGYYGVTSPRPAVEEMHPWLADAPGVTLAKLSDAISRGKGAEYDRILGRAAGYIQAQREEAAPLIAEFGPQMRELAGQLGGSDPELAGTLTDLAEGKVAGIRNLRDYIERNVSNAQEAAGLKQALAELDRGAAGEPIPEGAAEAAEPRGGAREQEAVLPGLAPAVAEQRAAAAARQSEQLSEQLNRPPESIEQAAGEMERTSPLFRGTEASPQREIFPLGGRAAAATAERPARALPFPQTLAEAVKRELGSELEPGRLSRAVIREQTGELARAKERIYSQLDAQIRQWRRAPIGRSLGFIDAMERGKAQADPRDQQLANALRGLLDERREQIRKLGTGKLEHFIENYFPHIWEQPNRAAEWVRRVIAGSKRPLGGPASFLKRRTIPTTVEGVAAGLRPVTYNPVELTLLKVHEMDRYIAAQKILAEMKSQGLARYVRFGEKAPDGWVPIDDKTFTVYGAPEVEVEEAHDKAVWDALNRTADNLGISRERRARLGGGRMGYAVPTESRVATRIGTPESVLAHEVGHILDKRYGLAKRMEAAAAGKEFRLEGGPGELDRLAEKFFEGKEGVSERERAEAHTPEEKVARVVEAWAHAPELLRETAPRTYEFFSEFVREHPELEPLAGIRPSLAYEHTEGKVPVGGLVIRGRYWMPADAAKPLQRYLSAGLAGHLPYDIVRGLGNAMNQAQLGLSAFHLGFTSMDASVSDVALGIEKAMRGRLSEAVRPTVRGLSLLGSPISTVLKGNKLLREYLEPGRYRELSRTADALAQAGGRVHMDPFYKNSAIESFWKVWQQAASAATRSERISGAIKLPLKAFGAALEYSAKPIMEIVVPRMKLGAFANLAGDVFDRARRGNWSRERTRAELADAWDSIDNRLGQVVYDNLFWNRTVKDLGMVSVRSLGWNLGTAREIGGGLRDVAAAGSRVVRGKSPEFTHRMAYVLALPIVAGFAGAVAQTLMTGKPPQELKDFFFPRTGKLGPDGEDERVSLPTYMKDVYAVSKQPVQTAAHKLQPALEAFYEMLRNEDYYSTEIRHPGDPLLRQVGEVLRYAAREFEPFSVRNTLYRLGVGERPGEAVTSMLGVNPAPAGMSRTAAENEAFGYLRRHEPGLRTREEFERGRLVGQLRNRLAQGESQPADVRAAVLAGRITRREGTSILRTYREPPLVRAFPRLPADEAMRVWSLATPKERDELRPLLARRLAALGNAPADERVALGGEIRSALGR